jgi:DNA repair protein RadD
MKPRYYQDEAVFSFFDFFARGNIGNPLIAMPTGTGKSLVMALLITEIFKRYKNQRILMATHVKELIEQNYKTLLRVWPSAPAGIYSAGLDRKDVGFPITYAGIGSIHKKPHVFQKIDIMIIDEAHLLSPNGMTMYRTFIEQLKQYNPYLIVVGLTATPFRLGQGMLTNEGGLFTHFCYDITGIESFNRLISEGYLCTLIPQKTNAELDIDGLHFIKGEFSVAEMQERFNVDSITVQALEESIVRGYNRKHWLIFATGVEHCDRIAKLLNDKYNIPTRSVHSKLKDADRDENLRLFKSGEIKCVVNNNCLTTGFDFPGIDMIVVLRPTMSPGLWVQMLGRGTRPSEGKDNCLVLDFAANTKRLGPINDPVIPYQKKKKGGEPRPAPVKICDNCGMYCHASVRICGCCGYEFPRSIKIMSEASNEELIKKQEIIVEIFKVDSITYDIYSKANKQDSLLVTYQCGLRFFKHWICLEHGEPAAHKARVWWRKATGCHDTPETTAQAIQETDNLKLASHVRVRLDTQFAQILDCDYSGTAFGSEQLKETGEEEPF